MRGRFTMLEYCPAAISHPIIQCFRGVVQLFNAVKQQQGKIKRKVNQAGASIRRVDKVRPGHLPVCLSVQ